MIYSNQANLHMLQQVGIYPEKKFSNKRPSFKAVGQMLIASIRMRKLGEGRADQQRAKAMLSRSLDEVRRNRVE